MLCTRVDNSGCSAPLLGLLKRCVMRARGSVSLATPSRAHNGRVRRRCDIRERSGALRTGLLARQARARTWDSASRRLVYSTRQPPSGDRRFAPRTRSERENPHQADVSAQEALSAQDARLPRAHGDSGRPAGVEGAPSQGTQAPDSRCPAVIPVQRLRGRARFAAVRARGAEGRSGRVRVSMLSTAGSCSRVGVAVVGARGAVERNRLRRQARAVAASLLRDQPGFDVVVRARAGAEPVRFDALVRAEKAALAQARSRINV